MIQKREPLGERDIGGDVKPEFETYTILSSNHGHLTDTDAGVFMCEIFSSLFSCF